MKVFQKALLVSVLSLGVSYPLLANEGPAVKDEPTVIEETEAEPVLITKEREIRSLQKEINYWRRQDKEWQQEKIKLQLQIRDLTQANTEKQASPSTNLREDVQNLQVTMKELLAEQKKFHRDYLRLSLRRPDGVGEEKAIRLLIESLAELENFPLEEKNK